MNYSKILRQIRNSPKLWEQNTEKIDRVLRRVKTKAIAQQENAKTAVKAVGPYSGLTREELRRTGTCEPDWF